MGKGVDENLKDDTFYVIGKKPVSKRETSSDAADLKSSDSAGVKETKLKKAEETKTEPKETIENQAEPNTKKWRAAPKKTKKKQKPPKEKEEELPSEEKKIKKKAEESEVTADVVKEVSATARRRTGRQNERRAAASEPYVYLPKTELTITIATTLLKMVKFEFRANTPTPTMAVTKEPDYYGYEWCMKNFQEEECYSYFYGESEWES